MIEPFLFSKAFDFSAGALGKCVSVVVKGLIIIGVILLLFWSGYVTFVKPHTNPTPTQKADNMTNYSYSYKSLISFGCMRMVKPDKK
jgi:hypothetical protein